MGQLEFTTPREAWGGEASAFTPLLGQDHMLKYLGEATGIGTLSLVEVEHSTAGGRSLDILAETASGVRVAIENQYGTLNHDHLTRGLAYAVATDSRVLVIVAEDHRSEFISVADYLNELSLASDERGITVWLVQVRAVRRCGDAIWSPEFIVRAQPNEWKAAVRREVLPHLRSLNEFYEKCATLEWAGAARSIIENWLQKSGASAGHDSQNTVALYHQSPHKKGRGPNVLQLRLNGNVYVCRGYLRDSSGFVTHGEEPAELDEQIRKHFPATDWSGNCYYMRVEENLKGVAPFCDWVAERMGGDT